MFNTVRNLVRDFRTDLYKYGWSHATYKRRFSGGECTAIDIERIMDAWKTVIDGCKTTYKHYLVEVPPAANPDIALKDIHNILRGLPSTYSLMLSEALSWPPYRPTSVVTKPITLTKTEFQIIQRVFSQVITDQAFQYRTLTKKIIAGDSHF